MAAYYTFEDYSGTSTPNKSENPYDGLIEACSSDPQRIQTAYQTHRTNRNTQQRAKLLAPDFPGVTVDEILANLEDPSKPDYQDPRHCLVFWARPPITVRKLILDIQQKLLEVAPSLWTMPQASLHMTALEINHSLTSPEIATLVSQFATPALEAMANYTQAHRARLVKPLLSYDSQALALSFLPAAGEPRGTVSSSSLSDPESKVPDSDAYTYHHLRRDLFAQATRAGVKVGSRYVVPSAHLTIARFVKRQDFDVERFVKVIEGVNEWLINEFWPQGNGGKGGIKQGGEWVVGDEKGLEVRKGTLWYGGGGETVTLGEGF